MSGDPTSCTAPADDGCAWCAEHLPVAIGEAAAHLRVTVEALRYYQAKGLVTPVRDGSGHRRFDVAAMDALHVVLAMRDAGFPIAAVQRLIAQKQDLPAAELVARTRVVLHDHLDDLARRRADLDRAEALLRRWCDDLDSTGW